MEEVDVSTPPGLAHALPSNVDSPVRDQDTQEENDVSELTTPDGDRKRPALSDSELRRKRRMESVEENSEVDFDPNQPVETTVETTVPRQPTARQLFHTQGMNEEEEEVETVVPTPESSVNSQATNGGNEADGSLAEQSEDAETAVFSDAAESENYDVASGEEEVGEEELDDDSTNYSVRRYDSDNNLAFEENVREIARLVSFQPGNRRGLVAQLVEGGTTHNLGRTPREAATRIALETPTWRTDFVLLPDMEIQSTDNDTDAEF